MNLSFNLLVSAQVFENYFNISLPSPCCRGCHRSSCCVWTWCCCVRAGCCGVWSCCCSVWACCCGVWACCCGVWPCCWGRWCGCGEVSRSLCGAGGLLEQLLDHREGLVHGADGGGHRGHGRGHLGLLSGGAGHSGGHGADLSRQRHYNPSLGEVSDDWNH